MLIIYNFIDKITPKGIITLLHYMAFAGIIKTIMSELKSSRNIGGGIGES